MPNKIPKVKVKQVRKPMGKRGTPLDKNNQMDEAMRKAFKEKSDAKP